MAEIVNGDLLDAFTTAFPDVGIVFDLDGRIVQVFAGPGTDLLLFESPEQAIGQTAHDVLRKGAADRLVETIERALETGSLQTTEYVVETETGAHSFEARAAPIRQGDGPPSLVVLIARDVTTRDLYAKKLDEKLRVLRVIRDLTQTLSQVKTRPELEQAICDTLVESSPYLYAWIGRYDPENQVVTPTTHLDNGDDLLDEIDLRAAELGVEYRTAAAAVETGASQVLQNIYDSTTETHPGERPLSGGYHSVASFPMLKDDDVVSVLTVYADRPFAFDFDERTLFRDLTRDLALAFSAIDARNALEAREAELTERNTEWEILNRLVRHDIRNKMMLVLGWGEMLEARVDDDGREYLDRVLATSQQVVDITTDSRGLAESLAAQGDVELDAVDFQSILSEELEIARNEHPEASVSVETEIPPVSVRANQFLSSVFRNLLSNAIVHNASDSPVVAVSVETTSASVLVHVADDGPGIPADRKPDLFEISPDPNGNGHGFGLFLVMSLVDQYGGDVGVADNSPTGSVFTVELARA